MAFLGHQWRAMLDTIFVVSWLSEAICVLPRSGLQSYSIGEEKSHMDMGGRKITGKKEKFPDQLSFYGECRWGKEVTESEPGGFRAITLPVYTGLLSMYAMGRRLLPAFLSCLLLCLPYHDRLFSSRTVNHISPLSFKCAVWHWNLWCLSPLSSLALVMVFYHSKEKLSLPFCGSEQ